MSRLSLRSAVLLGLLIGASAPTFAATVQHVGTAKSAVALKTYGMKVDPERALRGVLPAGWQLSVAPGGSLDGKVSWTPTDTWVEVLERIAEHSKADIHVNWDNQEVFVSPNSVDTVSADTSAPVQEATPAPAPAVAVAALPPALPAVAAVNSAPVAPPAPVAAPALPSEPEVVAVSEQSPTEEISLAGPARAFNRTHLREPLEALAQRHGLRLIYEAGDIALPGALTLLLEDDIEQDLVLMAKAFGKQLPLELTIYRAEKELVAGPSGFFAFADLEARPVVPVKRSLFARLFNRVEPSSQPLPEAQASTPTPSAEVAVVAVTQEPTAVAPVIEASAKAPEPALTAAVPVLAPAVIPALPEPTAAPVPATTEALPVVVPAEQPAPVIELLALELAQGERLSVALDRLLKSRGWNLVWRVNVDLEAATAARVEGKSIAEILELVLPQLGLIADLYNPSRTAVIRTTNDTASQGAQ